MSGTCVLYTGVLWSDGGVGYNNLALGEVIDRAVFKDNHNIQSIELLNKADNCAWTPA